MKEKLFYQIALSILRDALQKADDHATSEYRMALEDAIECCRKELAD
jgi:hypothetical protein